jgi:uncharacterized protein YndB with AHSA1/START domain
VSRADNGTNEEHTGGVPPIASSVEIGRPPGEVFSYATDPARFGEWQRGVVGGHLDGKPGVGAHCTMTRRIGGAKRTSTSVITVFDPPEHWALHGIDGPIRAEVSVGIEPLGGDRGSRVTIELEFHGHSFGRLLAPMVTRRARREVPVSCRHLKERLEQPG